MQGELGEALEDLRRSSQRIQSLDPSDYPALEEALRARGSCIARLCAAVRNMPPDDRAALAEAADALAGARAQGAELLLRLKLSRGAAASDLEALGRECDLLRGLAEGPEPGRSVDYSA